MSAVDEHNAKRRVMNYLMEWGVEDAPARANRVMEDLMRAGWRMAPERETRPVPPKPSEACRTCGRHASACACDDGPRTRPLPKSPDTSERVAELRAAAAQPTDRPTTTAREGLRGAHR